MARRREQERPASADDPVPLELLAGPCVELWTRDGDRVRAFGRWSRARCAWLDDRGIERFRPPPELDRFVHPWSFETVRSSGPGAVAARLEKLGLPPGWEPVYVGDEPARARRQGGDRV